MNKFIDKTQKSTFFFREIDAFCFFTRHKQKNQCFWCTGVGLFNWERLNFMGPSNCWEATNSRASVCRWLWSLDFRGCLRRELGKLSWMSSIPSDQIAQLTCQRLVLNQGCGFLVSSYIAYGLLKLFIGENTLINAVWNGLLPYNVIRNWTDTFARSNWESHMWHTDTLRHFQRKNMLFFGSAEKIDLFQHYYKACLSELLVFFLI